MLLTLLESTPTPPHLYAVGTIDAKATASGAPSVGGSGAAVFTSGAVVAAALLQGAPLRPPDCVATSGVVAATSDCAAALAPGLPLTAAAALTAVPSVVVGGQVSAGTDWQAFAPVVVTGGGGPVQPPGSVAANGTVLAQARCTLDGTDAVQGIALVGTMAAAAQLTARGSVVCGGSLRVGATFTLGTALTGKITSAGRIRSGHGRVLDRVTRVRFRVRPRSRRLGGIRGPTARAA